MKQLFFILFVALIIFSGCNKYIAAIETAECDKAETGITGYSKAANMEKIMDEFTKKGIPGVVMAVKSEEGYWATAKGYAKIETKTPMALCHLQYLQSISKTYMAVAILKLYEQGKINLDDPMTKYLPEKYHHYILDGDKMTVRMLLSHTSGVPEYNFSPAYVSYLLQSPAHTFEPEDYLRYVKNKKLRFTPGSNYTYTNTNYVLLALIGDALTGNHAQFIAENIFRPLKLDNTYYRDDKSYPQYENLVNSYWDRHSDGIVENVSTLQRNNVACLAGDDGIVTTPEDAVTFLKALADGRLLSDSTMRQMKTWVKNKDGHPAYGLGLVYREINGIAGYGHSGGGIGAGCELYYFPEKNLCYFIAINLGTVTESPLHKDIEKLLAQLHIELLK